MTGRHESWTNVYPCGRNSTFDGPDGLEQAEKCAALNPGRIGPARHMVELREGEAIVPMEPTLDMVGAARDEADCIGDIYRAMIAARPE